MRVVGGVARLGEETEQAKIRFLELTAGSEAARKEQLSWVSQKPISLANYFDSKDFRSFPDRVKAGFEDAYKNINPSELDSKIASVKVKIAELQDILANPMKHRNVVGAGKNGPIYDLPDAAQTTAQLRIAQQIDQQMEAEDEHHAAQVREIGAEIQKAEQEKNRKPPKDHSQSDAMLADRIALAEQKRQHAMSVEDEIAFWTQRLGAFKSGSAQYLEALNEINRLTAEASRKDAEAVKRSAEAAQRDQEEEQENATEDARRQIEAWKDRMKARAEDAESAEKAAEAEIDAAQKIAVATVEHRLATESISKESAEHQLAAVHAKKYADELAALIVELDTLKQIQAEGGDTKKQQQETQNKITAVKGDAHSAAITDDGKASQSFQKAWDKALDEVQKQFMRVQDEMLRGQISIATGAKRMASAMALDAVHWAEKEVATELHKKAMAIAAKVEEESAKTGASATGAASRETIETQEGAKSGLKDAKSAAKGAFAATVHIPIIGPVIAPIAAASAFAAVMAFEQGGIIPGQIGSAVPILGHAGEAVLPQQMTNFVMNAARNSDGRGGTSVTNHFGGNTFNGVADSKSFDKMLSKSERRVAQVTKRAIRNGRF